VERGIIQTGEPAPQADAHELEYPFIELEDLCQLLLGGHGPQNLERPLAIRPRFPRQRRICGW